MKYSNLISASNAITAYKYIRVKLMLVIRSLLIISVINTLKVQTCEQRSLAKGKWSTTEHIVSSFQMFHFKWQKTTFPDVAFIINDTCCNNCKKPWLSLNVTFSDFYLKCHALTGRLSHLQSTVFDRIKKHDT